jgi:hypothetical protein
LPRYSRGRIDHDLQVAVPALIEAAKRVRCVCQRQPMADDLAGADTAGGDQVAEEVVVALVVVASRRSRFRRRVKGAKSSVAQRYLTIS